MVVVLYSGGLDSTFVVFLLKKLNVQFYCVYIKICLWASTVWLSEYCQCEALAAVLCFPLLFIDLSQQYYNYIFNRFYKGYVNSLTPNPDIFCNTKLKFNYFANYCLRCFGKPLFYFSGHYVRKCVNFISVARDLVKDQTYFLCTVFCFCNLFFLLGCFYKSEVRFFITFLGLVTYINASSRGVCFLRINDFANFISLYCTRRVIVYDATYNFYGYTRCGYITVGQRYPNSTLQHAYVFRKQPNAIFITNQHSIRLLTKHVRVLQRTLFKTVIFPKVYFCKVNSCSRFFKCFVYCVDLPYFVRFVYPVRVLAKGQFLAIYDGGVLVAGMEII
ncbi:hypothetical protein ACWNX2_00625 [Candidatus Vidania fulgoroideorum]